MASICLIKKSEAAYQGARNIKLTAVTDITDRRWREEEDAFAKQRKLPQDQHLMSEELHEVCETLARMSYLQPYKHYTDK